jgi:protein-S-isoprenylcysteine O-methyltransferase Ste14
MDWFALNILVLVLLYWGTVIARAIYFGRELGKFPGLIPRRRLEQVLWVLWILAIYAWVGQPLIILLEPAPYRFFKPFAALDHLALDILGSALAWFALGLSFWGWKLLGKSWRLAVDQEEKTMLVTSGPYAVVRHPIYALQALLIIGSWMVLPTPFLLLAALVLGCCYVVKAADEERHLLKMHKEDYVRYCDKVGCFLPRLWKSKLDAKNKGKLNLQQQVMLQWRRVWPYNACHCLKLAGKPDSERFKQVAYEVLTSAAISQIVVDDKSGRYEYLKEPPLISLNTFSCNSQPEVTVSRLVQEELNRPFPNVPHTPLRFFLLDTNNDSYYLGVTYNHWTAEDRALRLVLHQILARYYGLSLPEGASPLSLYPPGYWSLFGHLCTGKVLGRLPLEVGRRLLQSRHAYRHHYKDRDDFRTGFATYELKQGKIDKLRQYARSKGGTVHDLFLAALGEAISLYTPIRLKHPRRRGLRIGSVIDLRSLSRQDLSNTYGLFVGYFMVYFGKPEDNFFYLLKSVIKQTTHIKEKKGYLDTTLAMRFSPAFWPALSDARRAEFFRKSGLAAGISNVNLGGSWFESDAGGQVLEYWRGVSTGPHLPLVLLPSTFMGKVYIGVSYRQAGFDEEQIERIMRRFVWRLETLVK